MKWTSKPFEPEKSVKKQFDLSGKNISSLAVPDSWVATSVRPWRKWARPQSSSTFIKIVSQGAIADLKESGYAADGFPLDITKPCQVNKVIDHDTT